MPVLKYKEALKNWPANDRPRERMEKYGPEFLSESELLSIILVTGDPKQKKNSVDLSRTLLTHFKNLSGLDLASVSEICQVPGLGATKASQIKSAFELGKRLITQSSSLLDKKFSCSEEVMKYFSPKMVNSTKELFKVVMLNAKNMIIKDVTIAEGSLTTSVVMPREVFVPAIRESSASIICIHNHPSGDPQPSADDNKLTRQLLKTSEIVGIRLLDHIIIGKNSYFSYMDEKLLR